MEWTEFHCSGNPTLRFVCLRRVALGRAGLGLILLAPTPLRWWEVVHFSLSKTPVHLISACSHPKSSLSGKACRLHLLSWMEGSTGCSQREDVNSKARWRTRECGGTAKGPGKAVVWDCPRWGTTRQTVRRRRMGRAGGSWEKLWAAQHWELMWWCDRGYERSMRRQMNIRDDRRPSHLKAGHTTAISGEGGQEKADWGPTCTRVAEMVNSNDQIGCT